MWKKIQKAAVMLLGAGALCLMLDVQTQAAKPEEISYVYVDETVLEMPGTQNIVIGFEDIKRCPDDAKLIYHSLITGQVYEMNADKFVSGAVLFSKPYEDGAAEDEFVLDSITWVEAGVTESIQFSEVEMDISGYRVTDKGDGAAELFGESETGIVNLFGMDESGQMRKGQSKEGKASEVFTEDVISGGDAIELQETQKVIIVLCAGHDSTHSGAQTYRYSEEVLNYKVVQYCKQELQQYNDVIVYTDRELLSCKYPGKSSGYCLNQRVYDAAALQAGTFIDFHFNSGGSNGVEVYYPNVSYNIGIHMEGQLLANKIVSQVSSLGLANRGALIRNSTVGDRDQYGNLGDYYTSIAGSKSMGMTGLIIEHAFLDGYYDGAKLQEESFLRQLGIADAEAIAQAYRLTKGSESGKMHFVDVSENDWYYDALKYVFERNIMTGLSGTRFAPSDSLCRAQFATIIHRMEGTPEIAYTDRFFDVPDGQYFTNPILWTSKEDVKIMTGYSVGGFGPADLLTREQMVTALYRYMQYLKLDTSARVDLSIYPDADEVSEFAKEPMQWAVAKGLIQGDNGYLSPYSGANRAECATLIARFMEVKQNEKPALEEEPKEELKEELKEETE